MRTRLLGLLGLAPILLLLAAGTPTRAPTVGARALSEIVVTFASPPLAGRSSSRSERVVDGEQTRFAAALRLSIPEAHIRWRYRIVLNGAAIVLPRAAVPRLRSIPGVETVETGATYTLAATTASTAAIARTWRTGLPNQGEGLKIGIIDDGVDQRHPYFSPAGYAMPAGFPRGQRGYTTAKVIVARAFAPPGATWKSAGKPFDPVESEHGTHVAGIAAGNGGTTATGGQKVSGVAPRAFIGNYKALTVPTDAGLGLNGNAAEIVAAIEAAVADGMDVINLSLGEPEVEPTRDLVALALDAAALAGVVPVVAAGNDFDQFGRGSLSSPGTSDRAITVAAVSIPGPGAPPTLAGFSSSGPTPLSLRLKPDVSAPGVSILSSVPTGKWASMSGTSMASPQIAGTAALLLERHPDWSVAQLKSALVGSGSPVEVDGRPAPPTRGGGGLADPVLADNPLVLATPASLSFGLLVRPSRAAPVSVALADAGGGAGTWAVSVETLAGPAGAGLAIPPTVVVPGTLELTPSFTDGVADGEVTGFVRLTRGADIRQIPFWFRVARPALAAEPRRTINAPGVYIGDTRGKQALVSRYRYPEVPSDGVVSAVLQGPEQVFRLTLPRATANFGVVIVQRGHGVKVEPRVVSAGDENRLTGYAALPLNLNPYLEQFGNPVPAAGAVRARVGSYDIVFDSATAAGAGTYAFRLWIDDTRPPSAVLTTARVRRGTPVTVRVTDTGSGVDPATLAAKVDGVSIDAGLRGSTASIATLGLRRGAHRLRLQVSDYQESRNMENVPPILPNTRVLRATFVVR